jgi:hypothetical protein
MLQFSFWDVIFILFYEFLLAPMSQRMKLTFYEHMQKHLRIDLTTIDDETVRCKIVVFFFGILHVLGRPPNWR